MEHTDAGVHTVFADVERPTEHSPDAGDLERTAGTPGVTRPATGLAVPAVPGAPITDARLVGPVRHPGDGRPPGIERAGREPVSVGGAADAVEVPGLATVRTGTGTEVDADADTGTDLDVEDDEDEDDDTDDTDDELAETRLTGVGPGGDIAAAEGPVLATVIDIGLGDIVGEVMEWQERALCAQTDPEAFFPEKGGSTREAKRICSGCEVRLECLEYALANDERFGIWGGMSERERRKQRRRAV
jgi:WhiB family redox-sensing transcriptional regulator